MIIVRFDVVADVTIDGQKQSSEPAPRLSVFAKSDGSWQLIAYANFNVPSGEPPR